jgi:hypothetical protein
MYILQPIENQGSLYHLDNNNVSSEESCQPLWGEQERNISTLTPVLNKNDHFKNWENPFWLHIGHCARDFIRLSASAGIIIFYWRSDRELMMCRENSKTSWHLRKGKDNMHLHRPKVNMKRRNIPEDAILHEKGTVEQCVWVMPYLTRGLRFGLLWNVRMNVMDTRKGAGKTQRGELVFDAFQFWQQQTEENYKCQFRGN